MGPAGSEDLGPGAAAAQAKQRSARAWEAREAAGRRLARRQLRRGHARAHSHRREVMSRVVSCGGGADDGRWKADDEMKRAESGLRGG